ncbi:uncharacterized protein Z518_09497 [Rhinocladiella mackenziei CBS 650.93]|uniref:Uncharacterized protein n=1 Tax=Rhinocladiella mackenziei CBS 650.93 TaxID=1442369 RepID=A0A0D2IYR8_9EURO|nr:uncharacterized protein Z518_09497 [Rhinocladiella mackenziei CBS 650.93]KIX01770.1 hypothetical protein Z518_09497 [Rhinocladiella mackenziei CBS 650.93]
MSFSAYQTNAKPRGRRGSHGEAYERQDRSRASSSASMKLSKTLSRTLDEVSVPRNSRPSSPAVYIHRQRALDLKSPDRSKASSRHSASALRSDRIAPSKLEDGAIQVPELLAEAKPCINQSEDGNHPSDSTITGTGPASSSQTPTPAPNKAIEPDVGVTESQQPSQSLGRETQSSRSLASMPLTVAEESDKNIDTLPVAVSPKPSVSSPRSAAAIMSSARASKSSLHEDGVLSSPRTSKSSLPDLISVPETRMSVSSLHDSLVAPFPKASVTFLQPSIIPHLPESGEAEVPAPVMSSPASGADGRDPPDFPPKARSPLASPPQSPMLHQYVGSPPPQQPAPYPYPYPPSFIGSPPFQPGFYPTPFTSPTAPFIQSEMVPRAGSAGAEDERARLLEKVSNVLPDINRLLQYYQETQGLLSEKDHLVKQAESQHEEEISKLRIELSVTKEEYEKIIGEQAGENVKLKGEVADLAEKLSLSEELSRGSASMEEDLANLRLKYKFLEDDIETRESHNDQLLTEKQALEAQLGEIKKQLTDDRAQHDRVLMELKEVHQRQMAEKEDEHARALHDQKTGLAKIQLDLAGMITKHTQQKKDLDSARALISEHEHSLATKTKELADALHLHKTELEARTKTAEEKAQQHKQEISVWSQQLSESIAKYEAEVISLRDSHQKEIEQVQKAGEERLSELIEEHKRREGRLQAELEALRSENEALEADFVKERDVRDNLKTELATAREAHETLKSQHDQVNKHHTELAEAMLSLKTKQAEWHQESERMERILQSLGRLGSNNFQGKGDQFFVSAFDQLALSVEEISKQFFYNSVTGVLNPRGGSPWIGVPDIMGASEAARGLRCLVVQSQIFSVLNRRIFQPFLFTSAYDECDLEASLSFVSRMIRVKSVHREAVWRTITMRAIYASAYGRKATGIAATSACQEIMHRIQSMTDTKLRSALLQAVRLVAKAAVQIWRRVRLEWDLIYSNMPSSSQTGETYDPSDVLLWVRPHIVREIVTTSTEGEVDGDSERQNPPIGACRIYLQGTALRQDSPLVLARRQELLAGVGRE